MINPNEKLCDTSYIHNKRCNRQVNNMDAKMETLTSIQKDTIFEQDSIFINKKEMSVCNTIIVLIF